MLHDSNVREIIVNKLIIDNFRNEIVNRSETLSIDDCDFFLISNRLLLYKL